jgi:hypothetical protein
VTRKLLCAVLVLVACAAALPARAESALVLPTNEDASSEGAAVGRAVETAVLDRIPSLAVITPRSLGDKLEVDIVKACQGGDDASCTAQFSDALGVDLVFRPTLARLGDLVILTLSIYDVKTGAVRAQGQRRAPKSAPEELLTQIPGLVEEVGARAQLPVRVTVKKPFPTGSVVSITAGSALVLGGAGLAAYGIWQELRYQGAELSREEASSWEGARLLVFGGGAVVVVAGAVLIGYGVMGFVE